MPEAVEASKLAWFLAHHHKIKPVQAVVDIALAHAGRKPMAVASGSDAEIVVQGLQAIGILELFQTIITPVDVARGKPAPDMFLLAANRMGVAPERCLVFEDGLLGIQAAEAAGMASVFVPTVLAETEFIA
jgi:HAD superfamily hydrolase (TIGR01509 family)